MSESAADRSNEEPDQVQERQEKGDRLRERIYVTFTALAVLMAMAGHAEDPDAYSMLATLLTAVIGVLLAGFCSDAISHMITHNRLPTGREMRHLAAVSGRALIVLVVPTILLILAGLGVLYEGVALRISIVVFIVWLAVIVRIAVHRTGLRPLQRWLVMAVVVGLGVLVVLIEQLAHG